MDIHSPNTEIGTLMASHWRALFESDIASQGEQPAYVWRTMVLRAPAVQASRVPAAVGGVHASDLQADGCIHAASDRTDAGNQGICAAAGCGRIAGGDGSDRAQFDEAGLPSVACRVASGHAWKNSHRQEARMPGLGETGSRGVLAAGRTVNVLSGTRAVKRAQADAATRLRPRCARPVPANGSDAELGIDAGQSPSERGRPSKRRRRGTAARGWPARHAAGQRKPMVPEAPTVPELPEQVVAEGQDTHAMQAAASVLLALPGWQATAGGPTEDGHGDGSAQPGTCIDVAAGLQEAHVRAQLEEFERGAPWIVMFGKAAVLKSSVFADHLLRSLRCQG